MRLPRAGLGFLLTCGLLWSATCAAEASGHADVQSVLSASQDAIHKLDDASRLTTDDPDAYKNVARQVLEELTGGTGPMQDSTGYHNGAIGVLARVRTESAGKPWQPAIQSAWANLTVAALQLRELAPRARSRRVSIKRNQGARGPDDRTRARFRRRLARRAGGRARDNRTRRP